jgi:hypothetical protein
MHAQDSSPGIGWGNAGDTFYGTLDGRIVALLYYSAAEVVGDASEMEMAPPAWFVVMADEPDHHLEVVAPTMDSAMDGRELAAINDDALGAATQMVFAHLERQQRGDALATIPIDLKDDPWHELKLGNDIGEGFPGEDAPTSDVPIKLPDGREIPGDSGPFGEPKDNDTDTEVE